MPNGWVLPQCLNGSKPGTALRERVLAGIMNDVVVFDPAGQPEVRPGWARYYAQGEHSAPQINRIAGAPPVMHGNGNIALESIAGLDPLIHDAVEPVRADISCPTAESGTGGIACQLYGPVKRDSSITPPLRAGVGYPLVTRTGRQFTTNN